MAWVFIIMLVLAAGYLPSFWIKLRLLSVPAINSGALAATIPTLLGGPTHMTVGLIATFVAVACIIAADTGAYFCGKSFGRTQVSLEAGCGGRLLAPAKPAPCLCSTINACFGSVFEPALQPFDSVCS
jgi:hypothetical protein